MSRAPRGFWWVNFGGCSPKPQHQQRRSFVIPRFSFHALSRSLKQASSTQYPVPSTQYPAQSIPISVPFDTPIRCAHGLLRDLGVSAGIKNEKIKKRLSCGIRSCSLSRALRSSILPPLRLAGPHPGSRNQIQHPASSIQLPVPSTKHSDISALRYAHSLRSWATQGPWRICWN